MSCVGRALRAVICSTVLISTAIPGFPGFAGTDVYIPSVGRRPGNLGSQWYTQLWIHNPSRSTANVSIVFLERNIPNPSPLVYTDSIPPGDTRRYPNTVGTLFGVEKWGALRIKADVPVLAACRMYNLPAAGEDRDTQGQAYTAIPASFAIGVGQTARVLGVYQTSPRDDSQFRYNFGWVETTGSTADVRVIAYDETGTVIGDKTFPTTGGWEPRYYPIEDLVPAINHQNVTLEMRVVGGSGKIIAVGSGVANHSNDATTFEMAFRDELLGSPAGAFVSTLNGLSGDVTLAAGANVTITPSGNTLTIASTGGAGTGLPAGTAGQTLYHTGSAWAASSALTNDGTNVAVSGNLTLPTTTAATGQIKLGPYPFIHNYGPANAWNTFVGNSAGNFTMGGPGGSDGTYNTGVGSVSLASNTTGHFNTAVGAGSLNNNTTGLENTAIGFASLAFNTSGRYNTATGVSSLHSNSTGSQNTASGHFSLSHNTGDNNTAIGYSSLSASTTGSQNTAVGSTSLRANTTGWGNVGLGWAAGDTITVGTNNTFLGEGADATADNLSNATAIGADAYVDASNKIRIGNNSVTVIGGQVAWSNLSDARAKRDIRDLDLGLDFVLALHPVQFRMIDGNGRTDLGFLAQDVEAVLGDGYNILSVGGDAERTLALRYTDFIATLVKAVQEQQGQIEAQQTEIALLRAKLAELEAKLAQRP
ncbi:MAG TPA: tail fiber domain-containing protein [Thermoanaerobaculaceae bacterium]|nr:tail fiber domain-containing protein [Thermoanaerobaculaceae bacterium]